MTPASAHTTGPTVLLIDADNLSSPELVDQALRMLVERAGPVAIRRAYGSPENLKGLANVMRELAIRPCANLPLTKNTTDMALAVDAMDLCQQFAPAVVAIGTGDADFAPLVLRLRERGVRTICFSQTNKMSPEVHGFYDEVVLIGARAAARGATAAPRRRAAAPVEPVMDLFDADDDVDSYDESGVLTRARSEAAPAKAAPKRAPAKKTVARKAATPSPPPNPRTQAVPAPAPARTPASKPAPAAQEQQTDAGVRNRVRALLEQVPGLVDGRAVEFGDVVKHLRDEKLLGRSASASRFLKKHAPYVELTPEKNPNKLHWVSTLP